MIDTADGPPVRGRVQGPCTKETPVRPLLRHELADCVRFERALAHDVVQGGAACAEEEPAPTPTIPLAGVAFAPLIGAHEEAAGSGGPGLDKHPGALQAAMVGTRTVVHGGPAETPGPQRQVLPRASMASPGGLPEVQPDQSLAVTPDVLQRGVSITQSSKAGRGAELAECGLPVGASLDAQDRVREPRVVAEPDETVPAHVPTPGPTPGYVPAFMASKSAMPVGKDDHHRPADAAPRDWPDPAPTTCERPTIAPPKSADTIGLASETPPAPVVFPSAPESMRADPIAFTVQEPPPAAFLPTALQAPLPDTLAPSPQETTARSADLAALIERSVATFLASLDPSQPRQVRFELKAQAYAGVWVSLQEVAGRVQVEFVCASEAARQHLSAIVLREADTMARRCRRDLQFRVTADLQEDDDADLAAPPVVEVAGRA